MILIDPELDLSRAADARNTRSATRSRGSSVSQDAQSFRLPSARTFARFLAKAQAAVRLRGQVTVLLTGDAVLRSLNRRFRGKNKATDVLSFPSEHLVPGAEKIAGDLAISVETALRQAAEQGHAPATELKVLILHGLLHLAGYDHETDAGEMERRERSLRARLRLPSGLIERASARRSLRSKARPAAARRRP